MSDEEQDFHIESADAGASAVIPCDAGAIKKGGYVHILCVVCFLWTLSFLHQWKETVA